MDVKAASSMRALTRVALGIGLLAFVLPFASVSCGDHELLAVRGLNAAAGGQYMMGGQVHYYAADPYFLLAILGAVVALTCQLLRPHVKVRLIAGAVAGLSSVIVMLIGQAHVNSQIASLQSNGLVTIRWEIGYWVALFALSAGTVLAAVGFFRAGMCPQHTPTPPSRAVTSGGVLAILGALTIIAACALPYLHYKNSPGSPLDPASPSVFIPGFGPSMWFVAEPVGVAILALAAGIALLEWTSRRTRAIAAGVLLAYGVQTFLLFVGYVAWQSATRPLNSAPAEWSDCLPGYFSSSPGSRPRSPCSSGDPLQPTTSLQRWASRRQRLEEVPSFPSTWRRSQSSISAASPSSTACRARVVSRFSSTAPGSGMQPERLRFSPGIPTERTSSSRASSAST